MDGLHRLIRGVREEWWGEVGEKEQGNGGRWLGLEGGS